MFLENSKYKIRILHKKLFYDEIITFFHISIHISLNIGPRILNPYTPEYPFPAAVHVLMSQGINPSEEGSPQHHHSASEV